MIASILLLVAMILPTIRKKKQQAYVEGGGEAA
jgi:hypothetical protein